MPDRARLLVLDDVEGLIEASASTRRMRELADVRFLRGRLADVSDDELADVRVVLAIRERTAFDSATLDRLPALELILQTGGHAYHVDADAARGRGVRVALGRGGTAASAAVPELTFGLIIGCMRHLPAAQRAMAGGEWPGLVGRTLRGRRLGLLGVGRHGKQVARVAEAFGMEVVAWRRPGSAASDDGVSRVDLDTLLRTCDVVSVHLRLSDESRGLLGARELALLKPGSILVNTARGAIVDEVALVDALRNGPLAGAGLDVFTAEPLPVDSPLRSMPNVVLTPHVGWTVEEVFEEFAAIATRQLEAYVSGTLDPTELLHP
ncbi:NAD(P)-dependent oxidoreductase [Solicola gregarius]|uniref:D-2-hydroxyacid dehydrogenase family protein n=1 Tax=Solicola gregarius TaxID=2908642 RepID=A0AA46YIW3_9ACTN|nr:NAD(P)-dependent oxidoreductase [Solicola gregarius]UYM03417.1 D-2-hydroxyacid dehydrogenase family protein [Solicola gregarius]